MWNIFKQKQKANSKINSKDGSELIYISEGFFFMGNNKDELNTILSRFGVPASEFHNFYDETPQRKIFLKDYWISKYAITNGQFAKFIKESNYLSGVSDYEKGKDIQYKDSLGLSFRRNPIEEYNRIINNKKGYNYPVSGITYYEAQAYAKWANCDLPTEAQWEKAARGSDKRNFTWGNNFTKSKLNSIESSQPFPDGIKVTEKAKYSSPFGCVQMCGNVSEYCLDYYESKFYEFMPERNPVNLLKEQFKVIRGGSTNKPFIFSRTSARDITIPVTRPDFVGFRIVKNE